MSKDSIEKIVVSTTCLNNPLKFKLESVAAVGDLVTTSDDTRAASPISELNTPVIGVFSGVFAKLDSYSVNERFYSADFWKKVLESDRVKAALRSGTMLGIFEHPNVMDNYTKDGRHTARHPQNAGFVVKRLWIEGRDVLGQAYLLNTPLGRLLATYFLAKDKFDKPLIELFISARGYSREDYIDAQGIDRMNPNDYVLQSFDVVMNPGIKGARVKIESVKTDHDAQNQLAKLENASNEAAAQLSRDAIAAEFREELSLRNI